jgi:hypothetical protein
VNISSGPMRGGDWDRRTVREDDGNERLQPCCEAEEKFLRRARVEENSGGLTPSVHDSSLPSYQS